MDHAFSKVGASEVMDRQLPAPIRDRIERQQDMSERLISWIQLAIIVTFAILYVLSQRNAPQLSEAWVLTPIAILIYFVLTVIRVVLAHTRRLGFWLLSGSILIDMALLYGLIWSFHLQYQQPASFYLKAPTLLYVFIFVALRALRFEVRYVVLAGIAASLGWLLMIFYVVLVDAAPNTLTHDYVQYLTSNSILLGAEFDKVISILVVTAIIAIAIQRARVLLVQSVVESQAKENLSRFFAPEVVRRISDQGDHIVAGIGEAVNLSAKLEKHNKQQGSRALTHRHAYQAALDQGYRPATPHRIVNEVEIAGVAGALDLVVIAE